MTVAITLIRWGGHERSYGDAPNIHGNPLFGVCFVGVPPVRKGVARKLEHERRRARPSIRTRGCRHLRGAYLWRGDGIHFLRDRAAVCAARVVSQVADDRHCDLAV